MVMIVSGGQTGVDRGALDAALALDSPCGGWCPEGRLAEDGAISDVYPLTELSNGYYRHRTRKNIEDSDGTVIIYFGEIEGGTELTLQLCIKKQVPYKLIDGAEITESRAAQIIAEFISTNNIERLNVAGPRASKEARAYPYAKETITLLLQ